MTNYIQLKDLEIYKISRDLSKLAWEIYEKLSWQEKKIFGDQFMESTDSVGANIAEGYSRFHFLDKIKFYYNARGSLAESAHWLDLLLERQKITKDEHKKFKEASEQLSIKLNNFIGSTYKAKTKDQ